MDVTVTNEFQTWLEESLASLRPETPASVHLDDGMFQPGARKSWSLLAHSAFDEAVRVIGTQATTMLYWALEDTAQLFEAVPKTLEESLEPPALYLLHHTVTNVFTRAEEYRVPVNGTSYGFATPNIESYYRCFRGLEDMEKGWEFSRGFYFISRALLDV
jgi:hypothetical protein